MYQYWFISCDKHAGVIDDTKLGETGYKVCGNSPNSLYNVSTNSINFILE